ncbi:hypothetical protein, partial [Thiolapillus sp.]|uniref:hypothetical protein n=1 Tax=Thiolapillus sp. TaxID=2017437 RepID=UPI003AF8C52F
LISHRLQPIAVVEPWLCGINPMAPKAAFGRVSYLLCHPLRAMERKGKPAVPSRQRGVLPSLGRQVQSSNKLARLCCVVLGD